MRFSAGFFLFLLFAAAPLRAEDTSPAPSPIPSPPAAGETPGEAAAIDISTPTPVPEEAPADDGVIEPLDPWYVVPDKTPTPAPGSETRAPEEDDKHRASQKSGAEEEIEEEEEDVLELENVETDAQLPENAANKAALDMAQRARRVQLTKNQKARLREARINRHRVMRETAKALGLPKTVEGDPRGAPELRACTLNLNNYGTIDDYKRMFKVAQLPKREAIEAASLGAITQANCDIVAVQSLLATTEASAQLAVKQFLRKLKTRTGGEWESYLGSPGRQVVRSAFFVRSDRMEVKKHVAYDDVPLTNFGAFSLKDFPRPPLLLTATVPGKSGAKSRQLLFLNFDFRNSIVAVKPEPEAYRMQIADGVRQIIHTAGQTAPGAEPPVIVVLGDRFGPQPAPATQLLEGRLRLVDFTVDGGCALSPENKVDCKTKPVHFKEFFGISAEGYLLQPKVKTKKEASEDKPDEKPVEKKVLVYPSKAKEGKARRAKREKTSEIYLRGEDLPNALVNPLYPGRYRAGTVAAATGLKESPLVWVELNW